MSTKLEDIRSHKHLVPYIDENIEHVGITRLRSLNVAHLRELDKMFVIQDSNKPLAVLLSYKQFLHMQKQLIAVLETLDVLSDGSGRVIKGK